MSFIIDKHRASIFERAVCKRFGFEHVDDPLWDGVMIDNGTPVTIEVKSNLQSQSAGYKVELIDPMTKNVNPPGKSSDFVAYTRKVDDDVIVSFWSAGAFKRRILSNIGRALNEQPGWSLIMTGDRGDCLCLCVDHSIIEDPRFAVSVERVKYSEFLEID